MAAERNARRAGQGSDRHQTLTVEALGEGQGDPVRQLVETHRQVALRHLAKGAPTRAFGELVRASRAVPMQGRLAAYLVAFSLRASAEPAAITLLQTGVEDADGEDRADIRRQLARLFRRVRQPARAIDCLQQLLAEAPSHRRARRVLNVHLEGEGQWDALDVSLEQEVKEALRRRQLKGAARAALARARACERLGNPARAALRYQQAAQWLEQDGDCPSAYDLRLLWLRSLRDANAPARALQDAAQALLSTGAKLGQAERARRAVQALGPGPGAGQGRRRETQRELLAAGDLADAGGRRREAQALYEAAVREAKDAVALRRLEATLVARRAWRELAAFYREHAAASASKAERAAHLTQLAALLEDELGDPEGAAATWAELVALTGDEAALREQVRLLNARQDPSVVRRALDDAVSTATDDVARAHAQVARAEASLRRGRHARAKADFEAALRADPDNLAARAGLAEAAAALGDRRPLGALVNALRQAPRRFAGRAQLFRRAGRLALADGGEGAAARWLWAELRAELPEDEEAETAFTGLCRRLGDTEGLDSALRALLAREPRGPKARRAWLERVALLSGQGREDEALLALREAVRFEPGHKEAWLALSSRLEARGEFAEGAWALEHAATSTPDDAERAATWERLGRWVREHLRDPGRANVFERRAARIREGLAESSSPGLPKLLTPPGGAGAPTALEVPAVTSPLPPAATHDAQEEITTGDLLVIEEALGPPRSFTPALSSLDWEAHPPPVPSPPPVPEESLPPRTPKSAREVRPRPPAVASPPPVEDWDAPPGQLEDGPGTLELPVPVGEVGVPATPSHPTPLLGGLRDQRAKLLEAIRADPLAPGGYGRLARYYDDVGDAARGGLMMELCGALEGDPDAAPLAPKLILSATDRAALRHPALRGDEGELLALGGIALCRAFPARGREAGGREEFRLDSGRGAASAAEALVAAVRILGVRAPDLYLSEENGPPFSLVFTAQGPRVVVGRLAVKRALPEAELRFFAGRALFTQSPDLLALRTVRREQLERGLSVLGQVARGGRQLSAEGRAMREGLAPKALPRIKDLWAALGGKLSLVRLGEAARHSANRAGLVVAGGIAPALNAMRAKKALKSEVVELLRFAASERYLELRTRRLGKGY